MNSSIRQTQGCILANKVDDKFLDIHDEKSKRSGVLGLAETFLKKFRTITFNIVLAPILFIYILCIGLSLTPGIMLYHWIKDLTHGTHWLLQYFSTGLSIGAGFFLYGFTLIFVVPLMNKLLFVKVKPMRDTWFSLSVIPWYYHNALTYLVRYTFLDFITPTPLNILFFKMMGMKVGKGSMINTSNISDPSLIEIGDYVTIGGSATLVAHYGMKGFLVIGKLVIKNKAVIGMKATLFADVLIEEGAVVKPHEVILPKTIVHASKD